MVKKQATMVFPKNDTGNVEYRISDHHCVRAHSPFFLLRKSTIYMVSAHPLTLLNRHFDKGRWTTAEVMNNADAEELDKFGDISD